LSLVQATPSSQVMASPTHAPPSHVSPVVQTLSSSQRVPSATGTPTHAPPWHTCRSTHWTPGPQGTPSRTSVVWQPSSGSQVDTVQGLSSSQALEASTCSQPVLGSHVSNVQRLPSS